MTREPNDTRGRSGSETPVRRRLRLSLALLAATLLAAVFGNATALASTTVTTYASIGDLNTSARSCLDVAGGSSANGAKVQQWGCWGGANQQWALTTSQVPGYFTVRNQHSGACLEVAGGSRANGAKVQQWGCWNGPQQLWKPVPSYAAGYFSLRNYKSGLCLDVSASSPANGAKVQQWGCWNTPGQQWEGTSLSAGYSLSTPVTGVQDQGSLDRCDGFEHYAGPGGVNYSLAASDMDSPLWAPLNVHTVRVTVPWDIAYHHDATNVLHHANAVLAVEQACLNYWLATAAAKGLIPEISFKPDYNYRDPTGKKIMVPNIATYRAAMQAFVNTYSNCGGPTCPLPALPSGFHAYPAGTGRMERVGVIAPWGEPDFQSGITVGLSPKAPQYFHMPKGSGLFSDPRCATRTVATCGPVLAAQMWVAANGLCQGCTVIAGDFSSLGGLSPFVAGVPTYVDIYSQYLNHERPAVWGVHPYSDVQGEEDNHGVAPSVRSTITWRFSKALHQLGYGGQTHIWFDEVHALDQTSSKNYGTALENDGANYLMHTLAVPGQATPDGAPVVTAVYYYQFADSFPGWSLVIKGSPYPPYWAIEYRDQPQQ